MLTVFAKSVAVRKYWKIEAYLELADATPCKFLLCEYVITSERCAFKGKTDHPLPQLKVQTTHYTLLV